MFSSLFSVFSALLLVLSHPAHAAPVTQAARPVEFLAFSPTITSPSWDTVWVAASSQNVSWITNNVPAEARNYTVTVLLGHFTSGSDSENLDIRHPLAVRVPIMAGTVAVTVPPNATFSTSYTVAVIGDSGDVSPPFTIVPSLNATV